MDQARRRFQFRLRTLLIGVTLLAVPCAYVGWQTKTISERKASLDGMLKRGGIALAGISWPNGPPVARLSWIRERLGDQAMKWIVLPSGATAEEEERMRLTLAVL